MIAPDSPAPSYSHRQKPNKAVVPSVLPDCSYYLRFYNPLSDYSCVYQCTDSLVVRMGVSCSEEVAMRRTYFFIVVLFGMATATFAQTTSSDSQTSIAGRGPTTSSGLTSFTDQNPKRPNSAISPANSASGRFACVATLG